MMKATTMRGRLLAIALGAIIGASLGTVFAQVSGSGVSSVSNASAITWSASQTFSKAITVNGGPSTLADGGTGQPLVLNSTNAAGGYLAFQRAAANKFYVGDASQLCSGTLDDMCFRSQGAINFATGGGTGRGGINASGNWTANAPASGDTLTIATTSGNNGLVVNGTSAGTAVLRFNTQATTGAQTATWTAPTNKPGAASGSVTKWIPVNVDGTTLYVPAFN